ncbi:MAG: hypothetical protein Q8P67_20660 [archaeon]|nr:hypothetical protein [archaeon]
MLGAGESGKATLSKQMRFLLQGDVLDANEKTRVTEVIQSNLVAYAIVIIEYAITKDWKWSDDLQSSVTQVDKANRGNSGEIWSPETATAVAALRNSPEFVRLAHSLHFEEPSQFKHDCGSSSGFWHYATRYLPPPPLKMPTFACDVADVVCSRVRTTGIVANAMAVGKGDCGWEAVLTGGQRSERRK